MSAQQVLGGATMEASRTQPQKREALGQWGVASGGCGSGGGSSGVDSVSVSSEGCGPWVCG